MDWWESVGAYAMGNSGFPALAVDMATNGPRGDFGYTLTALMNSTTAPIDLYPPQEIDFTAGG